MMDALNRLAAALPDLPAPLLLGLSGGADSVALFHLLRLKGVPFTAVHVHHGLRGKDADADAAFAEALCAAWHIPLTCCRATPPAHPGEGWAREARYAFFRQVMAETGAAALALAHQQDDQAETLLLHLLRGSGLTGLCAMAPESLQGGLPIVRPLLGISHQTLCQALTEAELPWREDATNHEDAYLRNRVRHQLLPLMEQLSPGATRRMARTALTLQADEAALTAQAEAFLLREAGPLWLRLQPLRQLPQGLQARVLRLWWLKAQGHTLDVRSLSAQQTVALAALAEAPAGSRCNLPAGWHGQAGWHCLHLVPPTAAASAEAIPFTGEALSLNGITLIAQPFTGTIGDGRRSQTLPLSALTGCTLRTRRSGDVMRPFGASGHRLLQDVLTDRRVDAPFRGQIPLLCRGSEVLLAAGVGAGDIPPFDPAADNVTLTWVGPLPWLPEASSSAE